MSGARPPMTNAERQRRHRCRRRDGVSVIQLEVSANVKRALTEAAFLGQAEFGDKEKINAAVSAIVERWARQRR